MKILVINCGSSSIKYELVNLKSYLSADRKSEVIVRGVIEKIGIDIKSHEVGLEIILDRLMQPPDAVVQNKKELAAVGHRVVHGGEKFKRAVLIDEKIIKSIRSHFELAPLHNPPNLMGIEAAKKLLPDIPQVAVFDTAFHQTMPASAYLYALPYRFYEQYGIRRYGFHGTSHKYVALEASRILKKPLKKLKLITCHLGNGCSLAAIKEGKSIDTSMGFTPLEGLIMGTRCGDIDPAIVFYLMRKEGLSAEQINELLNKKSGLLGLSDISSDMRDILRMADKDNPRAKITLEVFIYRLKKYIGAYIAAMNGIDALIFTAGIGENVQIIRERIKRELSYLLKDAQILVIPTNEELMIAQETAEVIKKVKSSE
ncbi:MAG: acetate kinase [Candidatus Omnitrophica bacterium]|nr:acetate kinase [Candidatus Omnitrophota bacterium]